jgi:hypothetical protein
MTGGYRLSELEEENESLRRMLSGIAAAATAYLAVDAESEGQTDLQLVSGGRADEPGSAPVEDIDDATFEQVPQTVWEDMRERWDTHQISHSREGVLSLMEEAEAWLRSVEEIDGD